LAIGVLYMPSKPKKHPKDMTTEEAIKRLFHPKVVTHLKKAAGTSTKRSTKR
jgi:hypothetical protein